MGKKRNKKISDLIRREVALLIKDSVNDPRLSKMMISTVQLSPDLVNARILYTVPDDSEKEVVTVALKKAASFIRRELSRRIELRYTPEISFQYDDFIMYSENLASLMNDLEISSSD